MRLSHLHAPLVVLLIAGIAAAFFLGRETPIAVLDSTSIPAIDAVETSPAVENEEREEFPQPKKAPAAKAFQRIDGCTWKEDRWNDGDSFHVLTGDENREIVARLYFVDTPEAETAYRDRIAEQAAYFGIAKEQCVELAHEAAAFTQKRLAQPFTVWTRWRSALGRSALGRVYCIILTDTGEDLNELLVENGMARIYGTKTALFDARDSKTYVAHLKEMEAKAKDGRRGGWGKVAFPKIK